MKSSAAFSYQNSNTYSAISGRKIISSDFNRLYKQTVKQMVLDPGCMVGASKVSK